MTGAATQRPTGTVSFLFSDIEQSTKAVAQLGNERYADLLQEHREILRSAFEAHNGVEVGTEGDAFFVAFASAADAVAAAVEGQRGLGAQSPLRVRMGVHTGEVLVRGNDYVGHDVHVAKRVQDAANGGQVLVSRTTADLVGSRLSLRNLGGYRLKDVEAPVELFQVLAEGLADETLPPRAPPAVRHNLKKQRTSFVGRGREIARVAGLLADSRLVTITGVGGSGKTRLALEVAASQLTRFRDGVFFVDLAPVAEANLVATRVAAAVGLRPDGPVGEASLAPDAVLDVLASSEVLVVLDNCEHLIDVCAEFADRALARCESLSLLATSREALDIEGEHVFPLRSLGLPSAEDGTGEAVALFAERAGAVRGEFAFTDDAAAAVAQICRRLDGMPLAIELAAAQVAHLSVHEIAERLDDRFALLSGGRRRVQRQQTLAATVGWSYELLDDEERHVLRCVAVFPGSFDTQAAVAVAPERAGSIPRILRALVSKSLVDVEDGAVTRYRMLETIRAYAQEKLLASGEADTVRSHHRDWVLGWLRANRPTSFSSSEVEFFRSIEHDCLAALDWSERQGRYDKLAELLPRTSNTWIVPAGDALRWYELALAHADELAPDAHAALCVGRAWLGLELAEADIAATGSFARRAIELAPNEDVFRLPDAYGILSLARSFEGLASRTNVSDEVHELGQRGLAMCDSFVDELGVIFGYGSALMNVGDLDGAVEVLEDICQRTEGVAPTTLASNLAFLHHVRGNYERARRFAAIALEEVDKSTLQGWQLIDAHPTALCLAADGRHADALHVISERLEAPGALTVPGALTATATVLGALAALRADWETAAVLLGAARAAYDRGEVRGASDLLLYKHYVGEVRAALSPESARALRDEGQSLSLEDAVRRGLRNSPV